jgi:hypothetical protein
LGNSPEAISERSIYLHYGGNISGLKPFGEQTDLISGLKNLRKLQSGGIRLIETNVEWKKYDYRSNTEKLLCKTFGSTRIAYSTSDEQVEESHYKPGGTVTAALGHWASRILRFGKDPTGCGRWSYACLGKNDKKNPSLQSIELATIAIRVTQRHSNNNTEHNMPMILQELR